MSIILAAALIAVPAAVPTCSWNDPGRDRYRGTVAAAVDRYTDIPEAVRERLKSRMASYQYDEMAAIRRDSVTGKAHYAPNLRDMHFGAGQVCGTVDRSSWRDDHVERGLVYCEDTHCIIVPTVCRNVSRIDRLPPPADQRARSNQPATQAVAAATSGATDSDGELVFDPPGAGPGDPGTAPRALDAGGLPDPSFQDIVAGRGLVPPGPDAGAGPAGAPPPVTDPVPTVVLSDPGPPLAPIGPTEPSGVDRPTLLPDPLLGPTRTWLPPLDPLPPVPEPPAAVLALLGLAALAALRRRRG